jgi:hypothetical protein
MERLRAMPRNSRWYAAWWVVDGTTHPAEHFYITERLERWRREAVGHHEELRSAARDILTEFDRQRVVEQRERSTWVMPPGTVTGLGPEAPTEPDQLAVESSASINPGCVGWAAGERIDLAPNTDTPTPSRKPRKEPRSIGCKRAVLGRRQPQKNRYGKHRLVPLRRATA